MGKICLIGASGFVGTRLLEELKDKECYNLDKNQSVRFPDITRIQDIRLEGLEHHMQPDTETVILLAAEHRDDVRPISLYYDVNVEGTRKVLYAMDKMGIKKIIFTSSVAVYGLNKCNPDEHHPVDPFNHYGKSKWQAEELLREWYNSEPEEKSLTILRPTVIFGERNRGNVYNLLSQISRGKFLMIGEGLNMKSMAYVGNIAAFIKYCTENCSGYNLYNYVDKPDLTTRQLVSQAEQSLKRKLPSVRIPYFMGMLGGYAFDVISFVIQKKLPISSIRVRKFCATTQYDAKKAHGSGFKAPFTLSQGLDSTIRFEFVDKIDDGAIFYSE